MNTFFEILSCTGTAESCCGNYILVNFLIIIRRALTLMQIVVPIILMVMLAVQFTKLVINPTEKKHISGLKNEILATVIFFILPYIINVTFGLVPNSFEMGACWKVAEKTNSTMKTSSNNSYNNSTTETNTKKETEAKKKKKKSTKKKKISKKSLEKLNSTKKNKRLKTNKKNKLGKIKGSKKGIEIVNYARGFVGNRYCWGGTNPNVCADCSGFVQYVFKHKGINLQRSTSAMWSDKSKYTLVSAKNIKAGDLVMYGSGGKTHHVAILTGNGEEIVHAMDDKNGITIRPSYKYDSVMGIMRIKGVN